MYVEKPGNPGKLWPFDCKGYRGKFFITQRSGFSAWNVHSVRDEHSGMLSAPKLRIGSWDNIIHSACISQQYQAALRSPHQHYGANHWAGKQHKQHQGSAQHPSSCVWLCLRPSWVMNPPRRKTWSTGIGMGGRFTLISFVLLWSFLRTTLEAVCLCSLSFLSVGLMGYKVTDWKPVLFW